MPYLDNITIHNFKSFKHANIKFSKGFNCIVGANGSGKSNILDALLFALGESSLKRMRALNTAQLINSFAKPKGDDGVKRAYVRINFMGEQQPLDITRIIKSNNKMGYRLSDKHVTRQEVIDALRGFRSEINETNIIAQGEISYMVNLNPKERRELIDVASGIKEFNYKKDSALKELEKVEARISEAQIMLNERKGFLSQLEKEKVDAERYMQLSDTLKRASYTLLKNNLKKSESDYSSMMDSLKGIEKRKSEASSKISELDLIIEKISHEREDYARKLNERSVELSGTNKILEGINRDRAVKAEQIKSLKEKLDDLCARESSLESSGSLLSKELDDIREKLSNAESELKASLSRLKELEDSYSQSSADSQLERIEANQRRMDQLYQQSEAISRKALQMKFALEEAERSASSCGKALKDAEAKRTDAEGNARSYEEKVARSRKLLEERTKALQLTESELRQHQKQMDAIYTEHVNLREQLALSGGGEDRIAAALARESIPGFHGRANELCTYDSAYEAAVNAAASTRLGYFVVDSAETADKCIGVLKSRQLGRASFIPINDIVLNSAHDKAKQKGARDMLIGHVKYDRKYERAFAYIFADTCIVPSISAAKSMGLGTGRFVTLDGELVERSGIVTGGASRSRLSYSTIKSRLRALEEKKAENEKWMSELTAAAEKARRESALLQVEAADASNEIRHINSVLESLKGEESRLKGIVESDGSKAEELRESLSSADKERVSLLDELNALKEENERIYSATATSQKSQKKRNPGVADALKAEREKAEGAKIAVATLSKEKDIKASRAAETEQQIKGISKEKGDASKRIAILDSELSELGKSVKELQEKMGKSDESSRELIKGVQDLESRMSKLSSDRGRFGMELEKARRDQVEQETRKMQVQTRISDIKSELVSYENVQSLEGFTTEELEAKRAISKSDMERLGPVNLKAPEVYNDKRKDVDEAESKVSVLRNEKESIISMISEIESRKLRIFSETLSSVNENFGKLYGYIFDGSASLQLQNPKDPFSSGLDIKISSPKNRNGTVESLSGGEKSLVIIMLIFAIQGHNPMSIYVFDEIDAALDKENSKKLSRLMKEVSKKSQLVVISHNDSLITAADTAIGVVHRSNESKVVGLQVTQGGVESAR